MNVSMNLNQLLSRAKNIFGHKTPQEEPKVPTPQDSLVSDQRLQTALSEVEVSRR